VLKYFICLLSVIFFSCAPICTTYLNPSDMGKMKGKKILSVDTVKTDSEIILKVRFED
jgi:hypothetical protein